MPSQSGNADLIKQRRAEVSRLYCQGWPQHRIAARFGVTQQNVSLDLKAIRAEWQRAMVEDFDRLKAEQLAKIDTIEAEAWRGWRRSLKDAEKKYAKLVDDDGDVRRESGKTEEGRAGDPRFLQVVDSCIDRRLNVIGGYAPKKVANTNPDGTPAAPLVVMMPDNRRLSPPAAAHHTNGAAR